MLMDSRYGIRPAVARDASAVCAIYNAALAERCFTFETEPRAPRQFEMRIGESNFPHLVADVGDEVVGWAGLSSYSDRQCYAGIAECSVYVAHRARGQGIGTALTDELVGSAEERGFHKLVGKLFPENIASLRLIERCGFEKVGMHRRHGRLEGDWRDVLVVERLMSPSGQGGATA